MSPVVGRIFVYPIKSLDRTELEKAVLLPGGALQHDREFALFDDDGKWVNGKRDPRIHQIRCDYDLANFRVKLGTAEDPSPRTFHLWDDVRQLQEWFSDFLGVRIHIRRNLETGFPDDPESPGPTIVSAASLQEVSSWFEIPGGNEVARRFRANLEIDGTAPFWEDQLYGGDCEAVEFHIGDVRIHGINPCQRCVVPSRDSTSGMLTDDFQRTFAARRAGTLPAWTPASRFNHYYRLAVNTRIPATEAGKTIRVGDAIQATPNARNV